MKKLNFSERPFLLHKVFTGERRIFNLSSRVLYPILLTFFVFFLGTTGISAQDRFNLGAYKQSLIDNGDISPAALYKLYPSGLFKDSVTPFDLKDVLYLDSIDKKYHLSPDEKSLLMKNGFVVTERQQTETFMGQFQDIYNHDLPVFISTDAMLHVFHVAYDGIMKDIELQFLIPKLKELLYECYFRVQVLDEKYSQNAAMKTMLKDVDIYFAIPLRLLGESVGPYYSENNELVDKLLELIKKENWESYKLFSEGCPRDIDFSQFKPRGHYTDSQELEKYFRAMMWLGRIELYLSSPSFTLNKCNEEQMDQTVQRQLIDASLIQEIFTEQSITNKYLEIEDIVSFFVGEQDNVTINELKELYNETGKMNADAFLDTINVQKFQYKLKSKTYSDQKILSQILRSDPFSTQSLKPASAFMLFGQRFVIDSYVTGQVVFDQIINDKQKICRLQPSTLDVLFALGNDASTQLLIPELQEWGYSDNLAGLRYLIDQYPKSFWESSLYNMWIYILKSLNPKPQDENQPEFMQTGAWGQEKMNTQLSSWTELRHDNLLSAKQSYSATGACLYPAGYVEPNPIFFQRMQRMATIAANKFANLPIISNERGQYNIADYFNKFWEVCVTLENIAYEELNNEELWPEELDFINQLYSGTRGCIVGQVGGWYTSLHYGDQEPLKPNLLVADFHTTPTDCVGNPLGWISHAGTGLVDMMISIVNTPDNQLCAYVGPVMSYHEYVSTNFLRLTDEEWEQIYLAKSMRPEWVWNYLADTKGNSKNASLKLFSNMDELRKALKIDVTISQDNQVFNPESLMAVYPNPMASSAIISLNIPEGLRNVNSQLTLYDIQGKMIKILLDQNLSPGHYLTKWDRTIQSGNLAQSGIYILKLDQGNHSSAIKVVVTD